MIDSLKVLAIIPSRAGSKGLPGKNHRSIFGKPLIQWTINAALKSELIDKIIVTTDDKEIMKIAELNGILSIERPPHLATDTAIASDVITHAMENCPEFEIVLYLQPTSPCRTTEDIDKALGLLTDGNTEGVVSVTQAKEHPELMFRRDAQGKLTRVLNAQELPRQKMPNTFLVNGAVYCGYRSALLEKKGSFLQLDLIGMVMDAAFSIDIDTKEDFNKAEEILKRRI